MLIGDKRKIGDLSVCHDYAVTVFELGEEVEITDISKSQKTYRVVKDHHAYWLPEEAFEPFEEPEVSEPEPVEPPHLGNPRVVAAIEIAAALAGTGRYLTLGKNAFAHHSVELADALMAELSKPKGNP